MFDKCPGNEKRNLKVELAACLKCGYQAEMFSDEMKVKCPKCGELICRQRLPSCLDWCKAAKDCMGYMRK